MENLSKKYERKNELILNLSRVIFKYYENKMDWGDLVMKMEVKLI